MFPWSFRLFYTVNYKAVLPNVIQLKLVAWWISRKECNNCFKMTIWTQRGGAKNAYQPQVDRCCDRPAHSSIHSSACSRVVYFCAHLKSALRCNCRPSHRASVLDWQVAKAPQKEELGPAAKRKGKADTLPYNSGHFWKAISLWIRQADFKWIKITALQHLLSFFSIKKKKTWHLWWTFPAIRPMCQWGLFGHCNSRQVFTG